MCNTTSQAPPPWRRFPVQLTMEPRGQAAALLLAHSFLVIIIWFFWLLDTFRLKCGCQRPDRERAGCRKDRAGQDVLHRRPAGHRCLKNLPPMTHPSGFCLGSPAVWFPAALLSHCVVSVLFLSPGVLAVTFCVLILSCKDFVGYIFTTDG